MQDRVQVLCQHLHGLGQELSAQGLGVRSFLGSEVEGSGFHGFARGFLFLGFCFRLRVSFGVKGVGCRV